MIDLLKKYEDYVVFTSFKTELPMLYFKHDNFYIGIHTNKKECLENVFDMRFLYTSCEEANLIGNVCVYYDSFLLAHRYDYQMYNDGDFVLKSHPMYIDGVKNSHFEIHHTEIHVYHYPREIVNLFNKENYEFVSFVSSLEDVQREVLYGVKRILSRYNYFKGIYSIHGAAVANKGKGYLFLAGSRSGKSSLFINLVARKYTPINDDIVFWTKKDKKIGLFACGTLPQIRKNTSKNAEFVREIKHIDFNLSNSVANVMKDIKYNISRMSSLEAIFIPEIGYKSTSITEIAGAEVLKKELRACMVHGSFDVDSDFLEGIKLLHSYTTYKLRMSNNFEEVCGALESFMNK